MIGFMDMTFCPFYKDCSKRKECHRPLTPDVIKDAQKWWGSNSAPIWQFTSKPECYNKEEMK